MKKNCGERHEMNDRCRRMEKGAVEKKPRWVLMRVVLWGTRKALEFNENIAQLLLF